MSSKPKSMANGIYNEPVVKPSRVKSIVNYKSDKPEIPKIIKPKRHIKGQHVSLESAGNINKTFYIFKIKYAYIVYMIFINF